MIIAFHHVGCLVESIDDATVDYLKLHPTASVSEIYTIKEQAVKVCFFTIGNMIIEFVEPGNQKTSLSVLLRKNPGFYHIGLITDDLDKETERLENEGYRKINHFRSAAFHGRFCSYLMNNENHLIELIQSE